MKCGLRLCVRFVYFPNFHFGVDGTCGGRGIFKDTKIVSSRWKGTRDLNVSRNPHSRLLWSLNCKPFNSFDRPSRKEFTWTGPSLKVDVSCRDC